MNENEYEERYCLFLDILGFQSHIDDTVSSKVTSSQMMTFSRLKSALEKIYEGVHYKEALVNDDGKTLVTSREVTQFSDSVIISYKKNETSGGTGVLSMLRDVHMLQLQLAPNGILFRGAITSGLLFHNKDFVFGPALNDAVTLERLANYPRVILDGEIIDDAGLRKTKKPEFSRTLSSMATEDFDGLFYVDYFDIHPDDFDDDWDDIRYYLEKLRELIKGLSNKKSLSIKVKHSWLRTKYNNMAKPFMREKYKKFGIHDVPEEYVELFSGIKPF
ncbi:MAG: hypothetical protein ACJAS1_006375 [Oleiphilaceae bacterium]|jgi:hypothetical protein